MLSATQKDCLKLESGATSNELHFSAGDDAYNMGLALLANAQKRPAKEEDALQQKMLAAVYLADAGQQGHGPCSAKIG